MIDVYDNYKAKKFPIDVMWADIDYMDRWRDFTVASNISWDGLNDFVKELHWEKRYFVPILDAGIAIVPDSSYESLTEGLQQNMFIKSGSKTRAAMDKTSPVKNLNGTLYGWVWPGYAAFPDWSHPNASNYWISHLTKFHKELEFDGLWIDMNEIANFCTGPCIPEDTLPFGESIKS